MHRINEVCLHVNRIYLENERVNLIKFHKESLQIELDHDSEMSTPRSPYDFSFHRLMNEYFRSFLSGDIFARIHRKRSCRGPGPKSGIG